MTGVYAFRHVAFEHLGRIAPVLESRGLAVHYVDPNNVATVSVARTFLKRLDLVTWRSFPPSSPGERLDTLHTSLVLGYFHFD